MWAVLCAAVAHLALATLCARGERPLEAFSEAVHVRRLDERSVGVRFEFVSRKAPPVGGGARQYETFPRVIDQAITRDVSDLRLVMTRGTWRWPSETLWPSVETGAPGVELWARMEDPDKGWPKLMRSLAGMTCASLDGLQQNTTHGKTEDGAIFAHLPSETVCTENISPWLKLLPCRNRAGLGQFISAHTVVNSEYYSLVLSTRRTDRGLELVQSLSLVLRVKDSFREIVGFNKNEDSAAACEVAASSTFVIEAPNAGQVVEGCAKGGKVHGDSFLACGYPFSGDITGLSNLQESTERRQRVRSSKWLSGWGDIRGTISTALYNEHPTDRLRVRHVELLPSFLRPRFDTIQVRIGDAALPLSDEELRSRMRIFSTLLRGPPTRIEFDLDLPPRGDQVLISYGFDKAFLFFDEFPPNPNRGFDVPSAVTLYNRTISSSELDFDNIPGIYRRSKSGPIRKATQALLVSLAHPDFSMPYNVITLSSTGFALFFGMLVNISVRKRGDRWGQKPSEGRLRHFKNNLLSRCSRKTSKKYAKLE